MTSSNGLTWTNTTAGVAGGFVVRSLQFCRDRFLGEAVPLGFDPVMKIFASTDAGASFSLSPAEIIQGAEGSFPAFAYGNGVYFSAGAYNYADFANQIFINEAPTNQVSTDGVTWRALGTPPSQSVRTGAVFFKNTFITVGGGGQIWQSDPFVGVANSVDARANLSSLTVSGATLSPAFASGTIDYQAVVQNSTASITVTPTAVDSQATIQVNFVPVASGAKSPAIPLNVGANPITVLVTAPDGSTKIYNVVVTRLGLATVTNLANSGAGSLRQAVTDLNLAGGGTINLNVTGTILLTGGELVLSSNLTINGPSTGAKQLTISGNGVSRVFRVTSAATVAIAKVTIANGRAPKGAAEKPGGDGGAIQNSGKLTLTSCRISDSVAGTGGATTTGVPRAGGNGGGIYNASTGTLTLSACLLDNNTAGMGGACTAGPIGTKGGAGGNGGAICNQGGRMTLVNTTISGNFAGKGGFGLSGVSDGSGGSGGGVQALNSLLAKFTACTISNNYVGAGGAYGLGGGINAVGTAAAARPTLANVLVARNSARDNSTGLGLIRPDLAGAFVSGKGNFVGVFDGASWASVGTGLKPDVTGTAALPADPRMGILADNGGPTSTHLLLPGSGAIAAGGSGLVNNDQLGRARPATPDIGAYQTLEMAGLSASGGAKAVNGNFYVWGSTAADTLNLKEGPKGTFAATISPSAATGTTSNPKRIMVFLGGGDDTMTTATATGGTNAIPYEVYGGPGNDILSLNAAIPVPSVRFFGEEGEDFLQTNGASATPSPIAFDGGPGQDGVEFLGTEGDNDIVVNWYAIGDHDDDHELLEPPFPDHRDGLRVTIDGKKFEMEYTPKDDDETIVIWGGKGNDRIEMADDGAGQHWNAEFYGEEDDDVLIGATRLFHKPRGHDLLDGGPGDNQLFGNSGNDTLIGGEGQNLIVSGPGANHVYTYGDDQLWLNRGDTLTILVPVTGKGKKPHKSEERKKPYEAKLKLDGPATQDTKMPLTPVDGLLSADVRFDTPGDYRLELKISPPPGPRHKLEFGLKVQDIPPLPE